MFLPQFQVRSYFQVRKLNLKILTLVSDACINVKEIGPDWVSLSWKRPDAKMRVAPIVTYKVEAWLCGEGAYWVEVGSSAWTHCKGQVK